MQDPPFSFPSFPSFSFLSFFFLFSKSIVQSSSPSFSLPPFPPPSLPPFLPPSKKRKKEKHSIRFASFFFFFSPFLFSRAPLVPLSLFPSLSPFHLPHSSLFSIRKRICPCFLAPSQEKKKKKKRDENHLFFLFFSLSSPHLRKKRKKEREMRIRTFLRVRE